MCVNDNIVVTCSLSLSETHVTNSDIFIVGNSNIALTESEVDGTGSHGGVDLSRLTATTSSYSNSAQATITLSSYTLSDDGLRLGCSYTSVDSNGPIPFRMSRSTYVNTDTVNIEQASKHLLLINFCRN